MHRWRSGRGTGARTGLKRSTDGAGTHEDPSLSGQTPGAMQVAPGSFLPGFFRVDRVIVLREQARSHRFCTVHKMEPLRQSLWERACSRRSPTSHPKNCRINPLSAPTDHHKAKSTQPCPASAALEAWQLNNTSSHRPWRSGGSWQAGLLADAQET